VELVDLEELVLEELLVADNSVGRKLLLRIPSYHGF